MAAVSPDAVQFAISCVYMSSAVLNGLLYIGLHSSVRRELARYLPHCRRSAIAPSVTQPVGEGRLKMQDPENGGSNNVKGNGKKVKADVVVLRGGKPTSELRDVTCHMGSRSVTYRRQK